MELIFATSNKRKFDLGYDAMGEHGINLVQTNLEVDEIQIDTIDLANMLRIAEEKAKSAYSAIKKPLVVSDDCWEIHALNGFPGPYMKSIGESLGTEDFLNLMKDKTNRRVSLIQNIAYTDGKIVKTFTNTAYGEITNEPRGLEVKQTWPKICTMDGYGGKTIAEIILEQEAGVKESEHDKSTAEVWHQLAKWLLEAR